MGKEQKKAIHYYDKLSFSYDYVSNWYYKKARSYAIKELEIKKGQTIINLPCGTGVNFNYFQYYLENSGLVIGIDLSSGMLDQATKKIKKNEWTNIVTELNNASEIDKTWLEQYEYQKGKFTVNAIFCDLGLSVFPEWQNIIDNLISILSPDGRIVILDWYLEKPSLRGNFIKWIGKGEVDRQLWQYLETKVIDFKIDDSFNRGAVFVASGTKPHIKHVDRR